MIVIILPDIPIEDRLLARARQDDQDAIMHIYDSYFPPVYNFIRLRVSDQEVASDLASEVFVELVTALRKRRGPQRSLRGWLFRVARNLIYDHYGKAEQLSTTSLDEWLPASPEDDPEYRAVQTLDLERARQALRMLVDDQQEVLILRFGQGLTLQETADIMGRKVAAVKSLQFRAVQTLREIMGQG